MRELQSAQWRLERRSPGLSGRGRSGTHTKVFPSGSTVPARVDLIKPATPAADEGSQNTPSLRAIMWYASKISSSVTANTWPFDSSSALTASAHRAGFPIRMAVARVSGFSAGLRKDQQGCACGFVAQ